MACAPHQPADEIAAQYLEARAAYAAGNLDGAERLLAGIRARDRRFHQADFLLGKVLFFENRLPEARRLFDRLCRGYRGYNEAEIWRVRTLSQEGKTTEAVRAVERLLEFDAADPRLLFLRGSLALEEDDLQAALGFFRAAAGFSEELARSHLEIARLYHQFGLRERALEELADCLALASPGSPVGEAAERLTVMLREEAPVP
jgi:tetratricopeptide (TPR) repeat protein